MSENKNTVAIDEQALKPVLDAVTKLLDERSVLWAHIQSFTERLNKVEVELLERVLKLETESRHSQARIEDLQSQTADLQSRAGVTPTDVAQIAREAAQEIVNKTFSLRLSDSPFVGTTEALAAIQRSLKKSNS